MSEERRRSSDVGEVERRVLARLSSGPGDEACAAFYREYVTALLQELERLRGQPTRDWFTRLELSAHPAAVEFWDAIAARVRSKTQATHEQAVVRIKAAVLDLVAAKEGSEGR